MRSKNKLALIALVVIGGALYFWPATSPDDVGLDPNGLTHAGHARSGSILSEPDGGSPDRIGGIEGEGPEDALVESDHEADVAGAVTRGSIYGKLHDHEGVEIAKGLVHFKPSDPAERGSSSTMADSSGDYQMTLRPGSWDVLFAGKPSRTGSGSVLMGRVDVLAGQEHMLDYYELGERKIEGGFYCEDLDMLLLSVEVSLARDASILIGKASAFTDHGETDTYLKGMEAETEDERPAIRNLTPGMGGFAFRGLSAEEYEIRAYLDVERRFYISTFVDLTSADFEFEPIGLTQIDFISKRVLEVSRRGD